MFLQVVAIVFPIFSLVVIGYLYAKKFSPNVSGANQLNLNVFLPALIISVLVDKNFYLQDYLWLFFAGIFIMLGSGVLAWGVAKVFKYQVKTFVPPMMFGNSGNMGLPLALLAFGESALAPAVVLFIAENTLHFTLGVKIINSKTSVWSILKIPMVAATFIGLLLSFFKLPIPNMLDQTIDMLGQIAIPLMLISLGVRLSTADYSELSIGVVAAIVCPLTGFLALLVMYPWLDFPQLQLSLLIIFSVLPPAVLNYMVAEQFNQEPHKVASIVMLGNLMSLLFIPLALYYVLAL